MYYVTTFVYKGKVGTYKTKSLTPKHAELRRHYAGQTLRYDPSVDWPFGVYAEVVND